jgi:hypothetical protein
VVEKRRRGLKHAVSGGPFGIDVPHRRPGPDERAPHVELTARIPP